VLEAAAGQNVQHYEVALLGEPDLFEGVAAEKRTERLGENFPTCSRCLAGNFTASGGRKGRGACMPPDRSPSKASEPSEGHGMRVLHAGTLAHA
jgi:hypothetical protein